MLGGVRTVASRFAAGLLRRGVEAAGCNGISTSAIAVSASASAAAAGGCNVRRRLDDRTTTAAKKGLEDMAVRLRASFKGGAAPNAVVPVRLLTTEGQSLMDAITANDADAGASRLVEAPRWNRRIPRWSGDRRPSSITVGELLAQLRGNLRWRLANEHYGGGGGGGGEGEDFGAELRSIQEFVISPMGVPITFDANSVKLKRVRACFIFQRNAPGGRRRVVHNQKKVKK